MKQGNIIERMKYSANMQTWLRKWRKKQEVDFLNLYAEMIQEQHYKKFVEDDEKDGLHFGPQGYEYLAKLICEKLKGIL